MNLTIDVGNTNIFLCFFVKNKVYTSEIINNKDFSEKKIFQFVSKCLGIADNMNIILSSVVPTITKKIIKVFHKKKVKFFLLKKIIPTLNLKTNINEKKKIGEDRITNAYYGTKLFSNSLIIIDFGTATTFDIIDKDGSYDGGIITPGIELSLKILSEKTAKLPHVKFKQTKSVIGRSTRDAIQSGFFWGYLLMIKGLINMIENEKKIKFSIILTGGNCKIFNGLIENVVLNDDLFNSRGLNFILKEYLNGHKER